MCRECGFIIPVMKAKLNLVVIRAREPERLAGLYSVLGLSFERHRHRNGPEHFASEEDGCVFEIYPASQKNPPAAGVRLGFRVEDVDAAVAAWRAAGGKVVEAPADSPWGRRAVLCDLEGTKVEIVAAETS